MKIAVVYNRISQRVINLFGVPNREKYGLKNIKRITDALKAGGHQVIAVEGDKDLVDRLEEFMPQVLKGERPGMVFNISYGIQGQARYTHVPGMLEMVGIPYVGSGPLAHSLALDKVVAKMIFRQNGLPTPDFHVLEDAESEIPDDLTYPMIVKPKNEAVSFGIQVVNDAEELRAAAGVIFDRFGQAVLVEQYVEGREINVGLIGNDPVEALPPVELSFGDEGPQIYTYEDKKGSSGREIGVICPARIDEELTERAQEIAKKAFRALGCADCARVDMRIGADGTPYILEINSLPSLGGRGSYVAAAESVGLDFAGLVNRLVEVAAARYFGTPTPPTVAPSDAGAPEDRVFTYLTGQRDRMEKRLRDWTRLSSRTADPLGIRNAAREAGRRLRDLGLTAVEDLTDGRKVWTFETPEGLTKGTLLIAHLDVPLDPGTPIQVFRRDPELLYGEGIATSRGPLVMLEYALRALKQQKLIKRAPVGVLLYADEGNDCEATADVIRRASARAKRVFVLRPGNAPHAVVTQRRGQRSYLLTVEGKPQKPGQATTKPGPLRWLLPKLEDISALSSRGRKVAVAVADVATRAFPLSLPHRVEVRLLLSYLDAARADGLEEKIKEILGKGTWHLDLLVDRPPLVASKASQNLLGRLKELGAARDIPVDSESSLWPSAAGLVPEGIPVVCGLGPVGIDLHTPKEAVPRISLVQRTLLLSQALARTVEA